MEKDELEKRCAAQEQLIMQRNVQIAQLQRDLARKQLYIERLERRIPKTATAQEKAEQVFNGKNQAPRQAVA